jgi:dTDP-4-amino-4,6-dideoxygalactose transaminase
MPAILKIAEKYGLKVLEDCAQAHGASINGQKVGSFGDAASFSFYPGKNLGAYGDAGCMVTNDSKLAELLRIIANHGQKGKHNHLLEGRNSRLDGLQAAILLAKLPYLEEWTSARIAHAKAYSDLIKSPDIILPVVKEGYRHVFHLYVIRTKDRNALKAKLTENAVETAIHYPLALPFLPCYSQLNNKPSDFIVAKMAQESILSIPMFAELSKEQLAFVAGLLN